MEFPQIRIQSQMAQLQIQQTPATQSIQQPKPTQTIRQPKAEMSIETTPGRLTIDQTQAWNDMDLKSVRKRMEEAAQLGKQKAMEGTARRVRQGVEMMEIEKGGNPIQSQAVENRFGHPKQFNIGWIPSPFSVKIDYQPAEVKIDVVPQRPVIEHQINKTIHDYQPGKVDVSLKQRAQLDIDFENLAFHGLSGFEVSI
ncbi:DUF6470 family protein [Bacillaceae bacterium S4-13-58]